MGRHAVFELSMQTAESGSGYVHVDGRESPVHVSQDQGRWTVHLHADPEQGVGGSLRRALRAFAARQGYAHIEGKVIFEHQGWRWETYNFDVTDAE